MTKAQLTFLRNFWGWIMALQLCAMTCQAQISIAVETDRTKYVRYEPIECAIKLRNYSGNALFFGEKKSETGQGHLTFVVESEGGRMVPLLVDRFNPALNLVLGAGETKVLNITLNKVFELQRDGIYTMHVTVGHSRLRQDFESAPVIFEIVEGVAAWNCSIGTPVGQANAKVPARTVSLLIVHEGSRDVYCLRIEDETMVYCVLRLGSRISGSTPECDVDAMSKIHVLIQTRSRLYTYQVFDPDGTRMLERFYLATTESGPHLLRDPDIGRIMVSGGVVAREGVDFERTDSAQGNMVDLIVPEADLNLPGAKAPDDSKLVPPKRPSPAK